MQSNEKIIATYNKVAANYAAHYFNELDGKPLDRLLLKLFAETNQHNKIIDIGCGPGQTTRFLFDNDCKDIIGTDLSPAMVQSAKSINTDLEFEVADMLNLAYPGNTFGAALAFYAIVNFDYPGIQTAFAQINRVLKTGAQFLFSFHTGDERVHLDTLLDEQVDIDFYFLNTDKIIGLLKETGFNILDTVIRYPYTGEYQSKRAYITAAKV